MFMKKLFISAVVAVSLVMLLNGCIAIGTGPKSQQTNATHSQQLIDLQNAKNAGAITDAEYRDAEGEVAGQYAPQRPGQINSAGSPQSHRPARSRISVHREEDHELIFCKSATNASTSSGVVSQLHMSRDSSGVTTPV